MADNIAAVHGVIKFLWHKIKEEEILDPANYGGLIPIIAHHETPALLQAMDAEDGIKHFPYIIFSWNTNGYGQDWFNPCDQAVFRIKSHDPVKLRELLLLFTDYLKRFDESADIVDYYIETGKCHDDCPADPVDTIPASFKEYGYQYIEVLAATSGGVVEDENAPVEGMVTIKIEYTHDRDSKRLNKRVYPNEPGYVPPGP